MVISQEHGLCVETPIVRHVYPQRSDSLGYVKHFVHTQFDVKAGDDPFQFLIDLIGKEADTDNSLWH